MSRSFALPTFDTLQDEEAPFRPEDVLYSGSEEDASTGEERARKRQRIIQAGLEYLQGREPFILTARLKGPFDRGWINPWAKVRPASRSREAKRRKHPVKQESEDAQVVQTMIIPDTEEKQSKVEHVPAFEQHVSPVVTAPPNVLDRPRGQASVFIGNGGAHRSGNEASRHGHAQADWLKRDRASRIAKVTRHRSPSSSLAPAWLSESRTLQKGLDLSGSVQIHSNAPMIARKNPKVSPSTPAPPLHPSTSGSKQGHIRESKPVADNCYGIEDADIATYEAIKEVSHVSNGNKTLKATRPSETGQKRSATHKERGDDESRARHRSSRVQPSRGSSKKEGVESSHEHKDKTSEQARSGHLKPAKSDRQKLSPRAIPPSTYQPGFEYQVPRKTNSVQSNSSTPFESALEHMSSENESSIKDHSHKSNAERARDQKSQTAAARSGKSKAPGKLSGFRRLTFTPNGGPSLQRSRSPSQDSIKDHIEVKEEPRPSGAEEVVIIKSSTRSSDVPHDKNAKSNESTGFLPEAQIISDPLRTRQLASEPSTDMLETDKKSIVAIEYNEEDSYADLATQAAMEKARQRFNNNDIIADLKTPNRHINEHLSQSKSSSLTNVHGGNDWQELQKQKEDAVPMDTQAMINGISPFYLMTSKKRSPVKADSPTAQSPTSPVSPSAPMTFPQYSPSMDTSQSNPEPPKGPTLPPYHYSPPAATSSKIDPSAKSQRQAPQSHAHPESSTKTPTLSALTSFSINPNGTLTETSAIQDGQQAEPLLIADESYTTLPEISFSNTAIGHAHPDPRPSAEGRVIETGRKPLSNGTPKSSAESRANDRSDRTKNGIPRSSIDQASGKRIGDGTPKKSKPSPSKSAHWTPGSNNSIPKSSGQSQPFPSPLDSPLSGKKTRNATTFAFGDGSMTRNDEEMEAALEDAGSFLGDWSVDSELLRGGFNPVNKVTTGDGVGGTNTGGDARKRKSILLKSKGRERRSK